ncbi:MAG: lipocalin family protein [Porticoccaceae bacterium]|jgi:apolipoprotein D and lipocalin family protein
MRSLLVVSCLAISSCLSVPDGIEPIQNFELDRYLGRWYEVARLDHSFERGLDAVTADYSLRDDGGIRVINSGRDITSGEMQQAEGRAYFVEKSNIGYLKVSFFGPFFGSYVIFELDHEGYQYAFVAGNTTDYLWLLARDPVVSEEVLRNFKDKASTFGFNTEDLIFVQH